MTARRVSFRTLRGAEGIALEIEHTALPLAFNALPFASGNREPRLERTCAMAACSR
jgi:hypothetical protein